jgi:putative ABC transport system ATP-binding protein
MPGRSQRVAVLNTPVAVSSVAVETGDLDASRTSDAEADDRTIETVAELSAVRFSWLAASPPVVDIKAFRLARGERVFLRGPSGSGKSTLLNLLAGVVTPRHGTVRTLGRDLCALRGAARDRFRADHIGYIFQMFNLILYLSVIENVCLPCGFSDSRRARAIRTAVNVEAEALRLLEQLDMRGADVLRRPVTEPSVVPPPRE